MYNWVIIWSLIRKRSRSRDRRRSRSSDRRERELDEQIRRQKLFGQRENNKPPVGRSADRTTDRKKSLTTRYGEKSRSRSRSRDRRERSRSIERRDRHRDRDRRDESRSHDRRRSRSRDRNDRENDRDLRHDLDDRHRPRDAYGIEGLINQIFFKCFVFHISSKNNFAKTISKVDFR